MTVNNYVMAARDRFVLAGIYLETAILDAELLARHVLEWDRSTYFSNRNNAAPLSFKRRYAQLVERRERREPVPFITGNREFWGLDFEITRNVLIPRPETELIIEQAIAVTADKPLSKPISIVDAGTGCGCLATALAVEIPNAFITATDISKSALSVARRNATRHGVSHRIRWVETSFLADLREVQDLIVSNPPYIPTGAASNLPPEVRDYEPRIALLSGIDGLDGLREVVSQAETCLVGGGWLIVEFGINQETALQELVADRPALSMVRICRDLQGIGRTAVIQHV